MHDRRKFLAMTGAAPLVVRPLGASQMEDSFDAALAGDRRLLGWATPPVDDFEPRSLETEGTWPADLRGTFRRIGPAAHSRHGLRYRHWFDADGMIQEFRLDGSGVTHRGRMLKTPKLALEDREGKRLLPAFGTRPAGARTVRRADDMNVANTALLDRQGELLALWEGGSASIIDRESLSWETFKSWGEGLEGLPFTAHPKVEPDGTLWAFGLVSIPFGALVLYHIPANGAAARAEVVPLEQPGFVHDFVVTRDYLVIVVPPFVYNPDVGGTYLDGHAWKPELGSRVLVVRKDDFSARRWIQLPAAFGFHHGNGWNEDDGTIHFDIFLADDPSLLEDAFTKVMDGLLVDASVPRFTRIVLRPDGSFAIAGDGGGGISRRSTRRECRGVIGISTASPRCQAHPPGCPERLRRGTSNRTAWSASIPARESRSRNTSSSPFGMRRRRTTAGSSVPSWRVRRRGAAWPCSMPGVWRTAHSRGHGCHSRCRSDFTGSSALPDRGQGPHPGSRGVTVSGVRQRDLDPEAAER